MNDFIAKLAQTENKTVIKKIIDVLAKHGKVYIVGKQANDKSKQLSGDTIIVSDDCNIVACGVTG